MTVLERLSSTQGRKDQGPNQTLAREIAASDDRAAIQTLVSQLTTGTRAIQNDCIKVLYEIGELRPLMIAGFLDDFLALLKHRNNRLQWGGMAALVHIARVDPEAISLHLASILAAAEVGSVITRDHAVTILIQLASIPHHESRVCGYLLGILGTSPVNQLALYAEKSLAVLGTSPDFTTVLETRLIDVVKPSQTKRLKRVIKKARILHER